MSPENIRPMLDLIAWAEDRLGLETVDLSKPAGVDADLVAELIGRNLNFRLILEGETISLFASGADQLIEPRLILRLEINRRNLGLLANLIKRLEFSELKDLDSQIIELGDPETNPHGSIMIGD